MTACRPAGLGVHDYSQLPLKAADGFISARGHHMIMELPTGQGSP